ncbi:hypothetical protein EIP86_010268 [Pleurotus ostreatoroseus]|nr:hypothetical protein EIP86_010268 [Pleurotus ostreatoroseus]
MDYSLYSPSSVPHYDAFHNNKYALAQVQSVSQDYPAYYPAEPCPYPSTLLQQYNSGSYAQSDPSVQGYAPPVEAYPPPAYDYAVYDSAPQVYTELADPPPPIHAPIPISAYSSLLPAIQYHTPTPRPAVEPPAAAAPPPHVPSSNGLVATPAGDAQAHTSPEHHAGAPHTTFLTPCQLLVSTQGQGQPLLTPHGAQQTHDDVSSSAPSSPCTSISSSEVDPESSLEQDGLLEDGSRSAKRPENQRKARFRSVADRVGFTPTDPDTITSHEKKRHYLASMERFVLDLHEHCRRVGVEPPPFDERFTDYAGLDTRSIRVSILSHPTIISDILTRTQTLLIHGQNECRELHNQVLDEERKYLELERLVLDAEKNLEEFTDGGEDDEAMPPPSAVPPPDTRRHSIASGMIVMNDAWHAASDDATDAMA